MPGKQRESLQVRAERETEDLKTERGFLPIHRISSKVALTRMVLMKIVCELVFMQEPVRFSCQQISACTVLTILGAKHGRRYG